jgi:hypothetical protein
MVLATVHCWPMLLKYPLFAFYVVLSIWGLYKVTNAHTYTWISHSVACK